MGHFKIYWSFKVASQNFESFYCCWNVLYSPFQIQWEAPYFLYFFLFFVWPFSFLRICVFFLCLPKFADLSSIFHFWVDSELGLFIGLICLGGTALLFFATLKMSYIRLIYFTYIFKCVAWYELIFPLVTWLSLLYFLFSTGGYLCFTLFLLWVLFWGESFTVVYSVLPLWLDEAL